MQMVLDRVYRGGDADNPGLQFFQGGESTSRRSKNDRRLLKQRQTVEPVIGHTRARSPHGPLLDEGGAWAMRCMPCVALWAMA